MRVEEIFKFYMLLERIILTCDLRIFGLKLLNIIHITLKDQYNLDIVISGILLIKILKTCCDSIFIPLELTPDIFDCFKRYFPINSAISSSNDEPMEFTKIFINTISLFQKYHENIFKMAFENISSSS
ncbi:hypothetical protein MXB_915 [Myxobolus squamalis]|nr:hypothetical protein MXB_915 [Myxobolus squamalis]